MKDDAKKQNYNLTLFFTWDVSLALWKEKGLLPREVRYYESLTEKGIAITFLTWGDERDLEIAKDLHKGIDVIPLYTRIPCPRNKVLRAFSSLLAPWVVRDTLKTSDILKTNQMWGGWCAILGKLISKKPLIVRTGFELYHFTIRQGHGLLRRAFIRFISSMTYKAADRIYLATQEDCNFVTKQFHIPEDKISIRPNWIDTDFFKYQDSPEKENHILFVGRLTEQKNLSVLIEAIADTPWTLDIVGEGELQEELKKIAQNRGSRVNFLGSFPNDALQEIYNRYPVFVLPSLYEGNPKTLLEAMACGRAVLGTNVDGIKSVIKDQETGLLCEPTSNSIHRNIELLLLNKDLRMRLGKAARLQIEETQTLEKLVNKELALYSSLVNSEGVRCL